MAADFWFALPYKANWNQKFQSGSKFLLSAPFESKVASLDHLGILQPLFRIDVFQQLLETGVVAYWIPNRVEF
jgi:hypothetical protein